MVSKKNIWKVSRFSIGMQLNICGVKVGDGKLAISVFVEMKYCIARLSKLRSILVFVVDV